VNEKIKIINTEPVCSFNSDWLAPIFNEYLEFEPWDSAKTYAPGTLHYVNCNNQTEIDQLIDRGFRVVVDNLWEVNPGYKQPVHVATCSKWFWYNESLWYRHLGYDSYVPAKDIKYRALMPMNKCKPHRSGFLTRIKLNDLLWSYCGIGRQLPGDGDMSDWSTQRYMNPAWYDQTYASMVVETLVRPGSKYTPIFITEKTIKPLAFAHPFIMYGNRGTLRTLREWGFETFANLWSESYDEIVDVDQRRDTVAQTLNELTVKDYDAETLQKLQHNKDMFFDKQKAIAGIVQDIVEPIIEYAETR
jgi:hypothetical protein